MSVPPGVPSSMVTLVAQAESLATRRDWDGANACYEQVLSKFPHEPYTLVQLSYMQSLRGNYRQAEASALAASRTGTVEPRILAELLPRLRTFNLVTEMLACIERAKPMSRMPIPLLIAVAAQLTYVNLPERAIEFLDEAKRADPEYPSTLLARAQVLTYLGRFDEAEEDIRRSIRRAPEIAQAYWLQAWLRRQSNERNHIEPIKRELKRPNRSADDIALLSFALHKELDDVGRYEEAWAALMQACRAKRSRVTYDAGRTQQLLRALANFEPHDAHVPQHFRESAPTPIFIIGMHRSGTTLLEQMLDGSSSIKAIGELYDFTSAMRFATDHHCKGVVDEVIVERAKRADLKSAGERYLSSVSWRLDQRAFFTDKLPSNFLNVGFIAHALPHAKILHMTRDPVETCFSNLRELFSEANPYSYDLNELADYFLMYRTLMTAWHGKFPGRILDVEYSRLVSDPEMQLRRVTEFCGIGFENSMLDIDSRQRSVVTASAVQVRSSIRTLDRPKWAPYEIGLAPLIAKLRG